MGEKLRLIRHAAKLSQTDIEKRTGLLRCYISRVENCVTVPQLETLEKFAQALGIPVYQLFYDGEQPPPSEIPINQRLRDDTRFGKRRKDAVLLARLRKLLANTR